MPVFYHGTSRFYAIAMSGPQGNGTIDVSRGEGEFGRGFYSQTSVSNAYRRGYSIYGAQAAAVLVLNIDDAAYHALQIDRLTLNKAQMLNARLTGTTRKTYTTSHDVIVGPLVMQPLIMQQKYQSLTAQALLNGPQTMRSVQ
jgi:hypothetical protein